MECSSSHSERLCRQLQEWYNDDKEEEYFFGQLLPQSGEFCRETG